MIFLNYLLFYGIVYPLSLLPLSFLYIISDGLYILIYKVFGYRKEVVKMNLRNSFPQKSEKELLVIEKQFYHHLGDLIVESIKNFSISTENLATHVHCKNPELLMHYYQQGRSVIAVTGHYANWEWPGTLFGYFTKHLPMGIYLPLNNKFWDSKMKSSRGKAGLQLVSPKQVGVFFKAHRDIPIGAGFIADQSPGNPRKAYWTTFLNQETAVQFGTEKYAKEFNCVVLYGKITKTGRGHYELEYFTLTEDPKSLSPGVITEMHTRFNEEIIRSAPQYWLWTHKRWKHKRRELVSS